MLYQVYETQRALMAPFSEFASASAKLYTHPLSPFTHTPLAQRVSAGLDLMHRLAKDYEKPKFDISTVEIDGVEVAVLEQVPITKPFCRLLRFKRFSDNPAVRQTSDEFFASPDQALYMANGGSVFQWSAAGGNNVTGQIIKQPDTTIAASVLFRSLLSRDPTQSEKQWIGEMLSQAGDKKPAVAQELVWSLLTSSEFRVYP